MDDHRVHTDLAHQNHVPGKALHRLVAAHGVTAKFDDDDGSIIALQIGQGAIECGCGWRSSPGSYLVSSLLKSFWKTVLGPLPHAAKGEAIPDAQ